MYCICYFAFYCIGIPYSLNIFVFQIFWVFQKLLIYVGIYSYTIYLYMLYIVYPPLYCYFSGIEHFFKKEILFEFLLFEFSVDCQTCLSEYTILNLALIRIKPWWWKAMIYISQNSFPYVSEFDFSNESHFLQFRKLMQRRNYFNIHPRWRKQTHEHMWNMHFLFKSLLIFFFAI